MVESGGKEGERRGSDRPAQASRLLLAALLFLQVAARRGGRGGHRTKLILDFVGGRPGPSFLNAYIVDNGGRADVARPPPSTVASTASCDG